MSKIDKDGMRKILKIFSQNLPIIDTLYPDNYLNLSQISQQIGWDGGTITKAVRILVENRFVYVKQEIKGAGKPQKILGLTEFSIKLYSEMIRYYEKDYSVVGVPDKILVDEYFMMLESEDVDVRQQAADGLFNESAKNVFTESHLNQLREKIFDPLYKPLKKELLQTLVNLARNTDDEKRAKLEDIFREQLDKLFNEEGERTDQSENIRILALNVLAEILAPSSRFQVLAECYLKLVEEGSIQASAARSLLVAKCIDHLTDIKLMLLRRYSSSDGEMRRRISDELKQL